MAVSPVDDAANTGPCRSAEAGSPPTKGSACFDRPLRWGQLTLVEDDPGKCDISFWLDYFERTHCQGALLSAGGIVAYYPTQVPLHHRSQWLADMDPFGELVAGCRRLGMTVAARVDPHAVRQEVYDAHPDWIAVNAEGNMQKHWSSPDMWLACTMGPYGFEHMTEVIQEIVRLYEVDAIFANRWSSPGMCYCEHCARDFHDAFEMDLPLAHADRPGPRWRNFVLWKQNRLYSLWDHWDEAIRSVRPQARFLPNLGGEGGLLDKAVIGRKAPLLYADHQGRSGMRCPWAAGKVAKEFRATAGSKPIIGIFSMGVEERYRWKDSVQSEPEVRVWVADGIANGLRPMFTKFSATLRDRRWLKTIENIYNWHSQCEKYLRNEAPLANVALVYSQHADWFASGADRQKARDHVDGMYHALIEARIPFEMVCDHGLEEDIVDSFEVLVMPDIASLSAEQCEQIRSYVERGGSVVATYETSLYDERGEQREDFGLSEVFGVRFKARQAGPMKNSYLRIEKGPEGAAIHPVLAGFEDAERIINGTWRLEVEAIEEFPERPLTLIPPYPDLPMEDVYPRVPRTDVPELYLREKGGSRIAYFNWDIGRVFWDVLCPDHGRLLANTVRWAARDELPVTVSGPGILDVTVWRQADSITVHLVNLTNPMMLKGPYRELLPLGEQSVSLRLPKGCRPRQVRLLRSSLECPCSENNGMLEVRVPTVLDHEVVAVDL